MARRFEQVAFPRQPADEFETNGDLVLRAVTDGFTRIEVDIQIGRMNRYYTVRKVWRNRLASEET
jgi:hypothetical protein